MHPLVAMVNVASIVATVVSTANVSIVATVVATGNESIAAVVSMANVSVVGTVTNTPRGDATGRACERER